MECGDGSGISSRVYNGREDGVMGSLAAQRDAKHAGRGLWAGSYVEPWQYRARIRASGRTAHCSDDAKAHPR
jgi:endonuclease YncB( thermonuclease family)